ncbi:MAG: hypothetical protein E7614_00720 [Ruminococcaceae bacterium]|nr:hypothetical protein [Oscillospiraceae bacterium]
MKKNNNIKKFIPTLLIACFLLSGCTSKMGQTATNLDTSTGELISQAPVEYLTADMIKNIKNYVKNAPSIDNISLSELTVGSFDVNSEISKRKESFVVVGENQQVLATDIVNVTFSEIVLDSGSASYELNAKYNFDLSLEYDSTFENGLIGKTIGEKVSIENCKLPDGTSAKVKVKINYVTRKAENFDSLASNLPEGAESYEKWLEVSLDKAAKVDAIWKELQTRISINKDEDAYTKYFDQKYNNAYEYYLNYNESVDTEALKAVIEEQCKKELIAYYYADEFDIELGKYSDDELKNIALYYGYSVDAFKAKYSSDVIDNTVLVDLVGKKFLDKVGK